MQASTPSWRRWLRFGLSHLLVLILGIALGFAPLRLWELNTRGQLQILSHVKAIELPRDQLASLGMLPQHTSGVGIPVTSLGKSFTERLKRLLEAGQARVLVEPVLATISGRASVFNVGGEIPVTITNPDGTEWVDYREFGTKAILTPTLLRNGRIRVDLFTQISTAAEVARVDSSKPPGIRRNQFQTNLDLACGETAVACANSYEKATGEEVCLLILATVERDKSR